MLLSEEQKRRYTAFWDRTPTDRACIFMTAWDGAPGYPPPRSLEQQWCDTDYREAELLYSAEHTRYYGEAFPSVFTNFGPGCLAACIGSGYELAPATVWFGSRPPFIGDWENRRTPRLDKNSGMYRMIDDLTERLLRHKDRVVTSVTDIGGTYDILASLRGTENLLYDMYDHPDEVKALRNEIAPIWKEYFLYYAGRLIGEQGGMTSWMPIWSDKPYFPLQCDYCAMLSPAMFREFILPDLREQTEYMDRCIYHLDGEGEIPHLDQILALPRVNAIQWAPGAGKPDYADPCWFDLYHRIQAAGKGLFLHGVPTKDLEFLFKNISQRGLFLITWVRDQKDADDVIALAKRLNNN